jgi:hypothetical protein
LKRIVFAVLALCMTATWATAQESGGGKRYALLVGVNHYDNRNFPDLDYAERDVEELNRALQGSYKVQMLLGGADGGKRATKANVDQAVDGIFRAGLTKDDTVLIAVAGHGQQFTTKRDGQKRDEPHFCPRDAVPGDQATTLNLSRLIERLSERGGGTNLLLVDACRNDPDPTRGRGGIDGEMMVSLPKGMAVFFSCSKGEKARESARAGGGHGLFFHFVLEALGDTAARNAKGELRWDSLVAYVKDKMEEDAPKLLGEGTAQTPHAVENLARSPVVLAGANRTLVAPGLERFFVERDSRNVTGGLWRGESAYPADSKRDPIKYELVMIQDGKFVVGFIKEPNTFGKRAEQPWLHSLFKGRFDKESGKFTFTKTYDGTSGISHDVEYSGLLSGNERKIGGTWRITGDWGAAFTMEKVAGTRSGPLAGVWAVEQHHPEGSGQDPSKFTLIMTHDGQRLTGFAREPNKLGKSEEPWLHADFKGRFDSRAGKVIFTKTYDGTAGEKGEEEYSGTLSPDGTKIEGTWTRQDSSGRFTLQKLNLDDETLEGLK